MTNPSEVLEYLEDKRESDRDAALLALETERDHYRNALFALAQVSANYVRQIDTFPVHQSIGASAARDSLVMGIELVALLDSALGESDA